MKLSVIKSVGVAVFAALFFCASAGAAEPVIRIMAVGDSITDGSSVTNSLGAGGPGGGYRLPLWQSLTNAGYNVDYLGLLTVNPSAVGMPTKHEGHGGWKIDQIYSNMVNVVFGATPEDPDVLLIMIGTNDFGGNYDVQNATNRLNQLVGLLTARWPFCKVVVASLTMRGAPYEANIQTNFNNVVPGIVSNFQAMGRQVYFTDMNPVVPLGAEFMPDNLHPNTGGYARMATNWFPAVTNVIGPLGTTNAPVMVKISAGFGLSNVVVTFSKPVSDATVSNTANYFLDNGLSVLGAVLEGTNRRAVTLTTTPMTPNLTNILVVTGIQDRTPAATEIVAALTNFISSLPTNTVPNSSTNGASSRGVFNNVPEAGDYRLVYSLTIPNSPNYSAAITYDTDLRAFASNFSRVAYYVETQPTNGVLNYMWVSFDAMTTNINRIGVPTFGSGGNFQMIVTNMNVNSSAFGIVNGTNVTTGNMEFWPSNYMAGNALSIPNASGSTYDWGDTQSGGNYACMQVHNHGASQVLFAFNHWNGGPADVGIGNSPAGNPDYTFSNNGPSNSIKLLQVFALLASNVPPVITSSSGGGYSNAVIGFSLPVADDATNVGNYALSGGLSVLNVALEPLTKLTVTLTTSPQSPGVYTALVNTVHDRSSSNSLVIATNTIATFIGPAVNGVFNNVPAATNYALVYSLTISNGAAYNSLGVPYDVAVPQFIGDFTRVAYYMELQTATGLPNYVWVELDPFTTNANRLGVPAGAGSPVFQQYVTNMSVRSSVSGIVQGDGIATGNMEFWPWDYTQNNTNHIQGAVSNAYDWGDSVASNVGGHGSMQLHNYGTSQVLFAFNNWGAAAGGTTAVGIGNRPGSADVDWTSAANAGSYVVKTLQVFALPVSNVAPVLASAGAGSLSNVVISFSKMLDAGSVAATNFTIPGATVLSATLDPVTFARVTLVTTPLLPNATYTSVVSNVKDRTVGALSIAPNSEVSFRAPPTTGAYANVPEATDYTLIHSIDLPVAASYPYSAVYDTDLRAFVTNFTRVAYYLELQNSSSTNFAWTSFDTPANNINSVGIPTVASGAIFQQPITNLNVFCSVTSVVQGVGLGGGNVEFWPGNYSQANAANVTNASGTFYDWGDTRTGGNHGSMQVHNHDALLGPSTGQVIFAFNKWGGTATANDELGIGNRPGVNDSDWTGANNANTYTIRRLQVYVLSATNLPPVVVNAVGSPGLSNVVLSFSDQLAESAATLTNFSIGGLTVLAASLDAATKTKLTLTTSPQTAGQNYTVTMSGIADRSTAALPLAPNTTATFMAAPARGALANVPEASAYTLVYSLNAPNVANFNSGTGVVYAVDNRAGIGPYSRIAYYVELMSSGGAPSFVWASMDAFTSDANKIGVPSVASGAFFQQPVTNLTVVSGAFGIVNGANMAGGNIEFWTNAYSSANAAAVPNASGATLDWGDQPIAGTNGSMQIHNSAANQTLFALNNWGGGAGNLDIGIGNNFSTTNSDWTALNNAAVFTSKVLQVYVLTANDTTPPSVLTAVATPDRAHILVTFSEPLADSSAALANFSLNNGATVLGAVLAANLRQVTLTCSQLAAGTIYTLTLNSIRDRSPNANVIPAGTAVLVSSPMPPAQIIANVAEATNFVPVYQVEIPLMAPSWNVSGTTYAVNNSAGIGPYNRIAYYMELVTAAGPTNWVYVSMDPFTNDVTKIGVPDMMAGVSIQKYVTSLNVFSSQTNISSGTGLTGNIEFWPFDYAVGNGAAITNASNATFDFGDTISLTFGTAGYGSMQVHTFANSNTLFAFNRWGSGPATNFVDVGIGSAPTGSPDWTGSFAANTYRSRTLHILVQPVPNDTTGPLVAKIFPGATRTNLVVRFNEPLDDTAATVTNFVLSGGLTISSASLLQNLRDVFLVTTPQTPGANYTLTLDNLRDRSTNANLIIPATVATFTAISVNTSLANVPEATNYTLVHQIALPTAVPNYNANGITYTNDQRPLLQSSPTFNRIAYLMELATNNGPTNWVWVSANAFTPFVQRVGVPVLGNGAGFQGKLTNMNVLSSQTNIVTTNTSATGNIEFWPYNYATTTNNLIPIGSTSLYDWNDTYSLTGQHGSMQIHNHGIINGVTGHVLFAYNQWGGNQPAVNASMGIGTQPVSQPDWTFATNAATFTTKNLYTLVRLTNTAAIAPAAVSPFFVTHPSSRTNLFATTNAIGSLALGTAPAYQWRFNGTPIAGQTNSWIAFNALQLADAGSYDLLASNTAGVVTSAVAVLIVNRLPVAAPDLFGALQDVAVTRPITFLLANDNDPDLDTLALAALGPNTANLGTATNAGPDFTYTPPTGYTGPDTFTYVLRDGRGGTVTTLVTVIVMTNHTPVLASSGIIATNGLIRFTGTGVSNGLYTIERTASLLGGLWTFHTNVPADQNGIFLIDDGTLPRPTNRFFRVIIP